MRRRILPSGGADPGIRRGLLRTTYYGGTNSFTGGTVFKITSAGKLTTLHSFCAAQMNCKFGGEPLAGVIQATDGDFYGTTTWGNAGVFRMAANGTLRTWRGFGGSTGLVQSTDGDFYGTTNYGGSFGEGSVFRLDVGLGRFVETEPISGKIGGHVRILGTNLGGATGVSFKGTAALFKVVSGSEISTSVPNGAATGSVTVTTPGDTLTSNFVFRITR